MKTPLCGVVVRFNENSNRGVMRVHRQETDIPFSLDSQRVIEDGMREPQFGAKAPDETFVPVCGSQVVVHLEEHYVRGKGWLPYVVAWNYLFEHQDSRRRINARLRYRIFQMSFYKGQPTSTEPMRLIGEGTLPELKTMFGFGSLPVRVLDLSYNYRVEVFEGGKWHVDDVVKSKLRLQDGNPAPTNGQLRELVNALAPQSCSPADDLSEMGRQRVEKFRARFAAAA